jgi:hypothetical protein
LDGEKWMKNFGAKTLVTWKRREDNIDMDLVSVLGVGSQVI